MQTVNLYMRYIKEVMKLGEDNEQEVMKSEDFLKNIQPRVFALRVQKNK